MILTDKAKEDFLKWLKNNYDLLIEDCGGFSYFCNAQTKVSEYALIIEWLDSVGIIIQIDCGNLRHSDDKITWYQGGVLGHQFLQTTKTRSEATKQAIIKANEIYNNLNTNENEK